MDVSRAIARLAEIGHVPTDSEDERLRKAILVFVASLIGVAAIAWGIAYVALGAAAAGAIPLSYAAVSGLSLVHFYRSKRYGFFRFSQLLLILLLPFLLQWTLGGFVAGSAVMLWAILSPLGGLMFGRRGEARGFLLAYLALTVVSGALDPRLSPHAAAMPPVVRLVFFVMNLGAVSAIVYVVLAHFVGEREAAQERSDRLLLNVLPRAIAERLKREPGVIADGYQNVTVLFADIVNFTRLSERIGAQELVKLLDEVFSAFDALAEEHGLEKIKTIGDAYMAVGGLPEPREDHAHAVAEMALDMLGVLAASPRCRAHSLDVRIGINTGPVVAGVIGRKKFIYDLWGDAVNTASRMESHGLGGTIQVTEATRQLLQGKYDFESRGTVLVKGKGEMTTYFLRARRTA